MVNPSLTDEIHILWVHTMKGKIEDLEIMI